MDEKTARIRVVNINDRYVTKIIQFKIDVLNTDILEVNYNIVAVNGNFSSPPICINLKDDNLYIIALLNYTKNNMLNLEDIGMVQIPLKDCNAVMMQLESYTQPDDMGRKLIEFSYLLDGTLSSVTIPEEILPIFISTFVEILIDKDIIEDEPEVESSDDKTEKSSDEEVKEEIIVDEQQTEESCG